jgi:hypothetical protein
MLYARPRRAFNTKSQKGAASAGRGFPCSKAAASLLLNKFAQMKWNGIRLLDCLPP